MKKALGYIIFVSGMVFGISLGSFLFLTGKDLAPKIKNTWNRITKKTS